MAASSQLSSAIDVFGPLCDRRRRSRSPRAALVRACALALCVRRASALGPAVGVGGVALGGFLGWAFQGVGPSPEARAAMDANPPAAVPALDGLLFGCGAPEVALYCGAKVAPASYAPLACAVSDELGGAGVLVLQSPFNVYAFKPARVEAVLAAYPSITCVAGRSIGGLWAAEFCRDLPAWPDAGLSFFYIGVHGKSVSLDQFKALPFSRVGCRDQLPASATIYEIAGGNHEQYGSYGSPGYSKGLAYKDLVAKISAEDQCAQVARAIAATARG